MDHGPQKRMQDLFLRKARAQNNRDPDIDNRNAHGATCSPYLGVLGSSTSQGPSRGGGDPLPE